MIDYGIFNIPVVYKNCSRFTRVFNKLLSLPLCSLFTLAVQTVALTARKWEKYARNVENDKRSVGGKEKNKAMDTDKEEIVNS